MNEKQNKRRNMYAWRRSRFNRLRAIRRAGYATERQIVRMRWLLKQLEAHWKMLNRLEN
jgi:hypothetical protein